MDNLIIDADEYLGAVKLDGKWHLFHDVLSMWMLDYASYEPEYIPEQGGWRDGLLKVDVNNATEYCQAMKSKEIEPSSIPHTLTAFGRQALLTFVVNFDERLFVNGWHDNIAIHEYAPDTWKSIEDDPYNYIPEELKTLWGK